MIPVYVYTTFSLSVHLSLDIWVALQLSYCSAARNMGTQMSFCYPHFNSVLLGTPRSGLLDYMLVVLLVF